MSGEFLSAEETLTRYKETYWMPELFEYGMVGQWQLAGMPDLRDNAREQAIELCASEPPNPLSPEREDALDEVFAAAQEALMETAWA